MMTMFAKKGHPTSAPLDATPGYSISSGLGRCTVVPMETLLSTLGLSRAPLARAIPEEETVA
jgi:hypothetical protein